MATRGRHTPRPNGDDRERAILATAERLLGERSLADISVDDLAKGAGLSRPTFYFYFASKEAVLLALLERVVTKARATREGVLAGLPPRSDDPAALWRPVITAIHDTFAQHRAVTVAVAAAAPSSPAVRDLWARVMERFVAETAAEIDAERARGLAPPGLPSRDLAVALNGMNEQVLHATFAGLSPSVAADDVLDVLLGVWLRALYAPDPGAGRLSSPACEIQA